MTQGGVAASAVWRLKGGDNVWTQYLTRRLVRLVVSAWVVVTAGFGLVHLIPGDAVRIALGPTAPASLVAQTRDRLGLNKPLAVQYGEFLKGLLHGNLGTSLTSSTPVSTIIETRLPNTLEIVGLGFVLVIILGIPLGIVMAIATQDGQRPIVSSMYNIAAIALGTVPGFLLGVVLVFFFGVETHLLPIAGQSGFSSYVLPALALSLGPAAALSRILRVEMLSVLGKDYIRTARAKRMRSARIYLRHALPNAMTATLTIAGLILGALVVESVLVETVFAWPGTGPTLVASIRTADYPTLEGLIVVYGGIVLVTNLIVDTILMGLDPRSTLRGS